MTDRESLKAALLALGSDLLSGNRRARERAPPRKLPSPRAQACGRARAQPRAKRAQTRAHVRGSEPAPCCDASPKTPKTRVFGRECRGAAPDSLTHNEWIHTEGRGGLVGAGGLRRAPSRVA